jgi:1-acyl-sn-glycerol-3-phosphate acyltransferase
MSRSVYARASAIDPGISIATVYRTVRLFEDAGILERHDFGDGRCALRSRARIASRSSDRCRVRQGDRVRRPELEQLQKRSPNGSASAWSITAWNCTASPSTGRTEPAGMTIRAVLRVLVMAGLLALCLPLWVISKPFGGGPGVVRFFLARVGWVLGLRVTIMGRPVDGDVLYIANHITWLDIPALGGTRYSRFVAKSQIAGWPLVGLLAKIGGSVFVRREQRSATRAQADAVVSALRSGFPVALFPEGGTADGVTLDRFRPALFAAAVEAGVTVQPIAIDYGARSPEIAWPDDVSFSTEAKRMLGRPAPVHVTLHFMAPLDATALDRKALAAESYREIAQALGRPLPR